MDTWSDVVHSTVATDEGTGSWLHLGMANTSGISAEDFLSLYDNNTSLATYSVAGGGNASDSWLGRNESLYRQGSLYPSQLTLTHIVLSSVVVTFLMIVIVVGNMLVIIAIATEKSLKSIQNWFIASLAVADFFLGLVIMPFSLANVLMGYWVFGDWWCDIHSAMDVLLCTASIMNLCLISLDRYWSITKAVEYLKTRTPLRATVMITLVWVMSGVICIPPLLGWKATRREGNELPQCLVSVGVEICIFAFLNVLVCF